MAVDLTSETAAVAALDAKLGWMRPLTLIGAIASTGWLLYEGFRSGRTIGCLAIFILLLAFKFGFSPLLAVSSIGLFLLHVVGLWLPLSACAMAAVTLYVDLRTDRLRRALASLA